jgi:serine/threonine-protein kinase
VRYRLGVEGADRVDLTGAVLDGRYRILEPLAEGAMGVVYRAERVKLGRVVAVKVLHESLPHELSSRKRFEIEARAMAKLEHPHCASVVDVGLHEDRPYVVMDFVSGDNLKDVLHAHGPLPIARAVEIIRQVLSGLAHAHELGIIHRDIKPANLVLSQKAGLGDHVKILDFGLARLSQDSSLTAGIVVGTPSYMAPEQIRGVAIDARVDLYACGVVLFEMLTGTKPFVSAADDPIEVCTLHLKQPPPRLVDRRPGVDFGPLEGVVARALCKLPSERFASAVELAAALDAIIPRRGVATPPVGTPVAAPPASGATATAALPVAAAPAGGQELGSGARAVASAAAGAAASGAAPGSAAPAAGTAAAPLDPQRAPASGAAPGRGEPAAIRAGGARPAAGGGAVWWRRRWVVGLGVGMIALTAIGIAARGGDPDPPPSEPSASPAPPAAPAPAPAAPPSAGAVARAEALIAAGDRDQALELVLAARRADPTSAPLAALAGRIYFDKLYWTDGMKQLRDAMRIDPQLRADPAIIKTVLRGFITTPRADPALAAFLREEIGAAARPYLEETASSHPRALIRARAAAELRRY